MELWEAHRSRNIGIESVEERDESLHGQPRVSSFARPKSNQQSHCMRTST